MFDKRNNDEEVYSPHWEPTNYSSDHIEHTEYDETTDKGSTCVTDPSVDHNICPLPDRRRRCGIPPVTFGPLPPLTPWFRVMEITKKRMARRDKKVTAESSQAVPPAATPQQAESQDHN